MHKIKVRNRLFPSRIQAGTQAVRPTRESFGSLGPGCYSMPQSLSVPGKAPLCAYVHTCWSWGRSPRKAKYSYCRGIIWYTSGEGGQGGHWGIILKHTHAPCVLRMYTSLNPPHHSRTASFVSSKKTRVAHFCRFNLSVYFLVGS